MLGLLAAERLENDIAIRFAQLVEPEEKSIRLLGFDIVFELPAETYEFRLLPALAGHARDKGDRGHVDLCSSSFRRRGRRRLLALATHGVRVDGDRAEITIAPAEMPAHALPR